jgi:hypothetical protein
MGDNKEVEDMKEDNNRAMKLGGKERGGGKAGQGNTQKETEPWR